MTKSPVIYVYFFTGLFKNRPYPKKWRQHFDIHYQGRKWAWILYQFISTFRVKIYNFKDIYSVVQSTKIDRNAHCWLRTSIDWSSVTCWFCFIVTQIGMQLVVKITSILLPSHIEQVDKLDFHTCPCSHVPTRKVIKKYK